MHHAYTWLSPFGFYEPLAAGAVVAVLLTIFAILVAVRVRNKEAALEPEDGLTVRNVAELFVEAVENLAESIIGHHYGKYVPLLSAFLAFILLKGMGPGVAEMEFEERGSDPVLVFMADKTEPGAWNFFLYKMFADPFNTPGLVIDPNMHEGFIFEVHDVMKKRKITFRTPEESYNLLAYIGAPSRYMIKSVHRKEGLYAASTSTQRLNLMAGRYVGKDDPVMIVRCQSGLPSVGELIEPFCTPVIAAGWMRGSHHGPFMPVGLPGEGVGS